MAITVSRPKLSWSERLYLPAIVSGYSITFRHFKNMLLGRTKVTMQYPEQKWDRAHAGSLSRRARAGAR